MPLLLCLSVPRSFGESRCPRALLGHCHIIAILVILYQVIITVLVEFREAFLKDHRLAPPSTSLFVSGLLRDCYYRYTRPYVCTYIHLVTVSVFCDGFIFLWRGVDLLFPCTLYVGGETCLRAENTVLVLQFRR